MKDFKRVSAPLLAIKDYGMCLVSCSGQVLMWNSGAEEIFGYTEEEVLGKQNSIFYTEEEDAAGLPAEHLRIVKNEGICRYEAWRKTKNKQSFYANISYSPFHKDNVLEGYWVVIRDSTIAQKLVMENQLLNDRLEDVVAQRTKELASANAELEAFSYSVSHDLRTPLRAISGFSEMLKDNYASQLDTEANRILSNILHNTSMMGKLIDDLLSFSRMGRLVSISTSVDMQNLVRSCIESIHDDTITTTTINIQSLPPCTGDPGMLRQVWMNLLDNACKYAAKTTNPEVEIGCESDKKSLIYYVKDNGVGFDMKYYGKLFGVFQRLHRLDEFPGTGLGLALAKRIISKHGGEIWGESSPGHGAKFLFSIPKNN